MTERVFYCTTCRCAWDEDPGDGHDDEREQVEPGLWLTCTGSAGEVYICPVSEAEIVNSTMIAINNPYETEEEMA